MRLRLVFALLLLVPTSLPAGQATKSAETEANLKAVRAQIERIAEQVSRDVLERDRLARELRSAESSVSGARARLERLRAERAQSARRRAELADERVRLERSLAIERETLAGQLRAAYLIGREEPLKLLLNQRDPARAGRMFAYYGYFGRARAGEIALIEEHVETLAELDAQLAAEDERLAQLEAEQKLELRQLEQARTQRGVVLASLDAESRSRVRQLERLKREQAGLERLLRELRRALERLPFESKDAFAKLRGKLAWPVAGRIVARYGETRAGGMKWGGMLLSVERGAPVRSVYHGRVAYADWLPGLGLLVIVDHGDGYLSLYGHNDKIYKSSGERVAAGDAIAAAGDSGGRGKPQLYFEIRKGSKPVDPRPWFRSRQP